MHAFVVVQPKSPHATMWSSQMHIFLSFNQQNPPMTTKRVKVIKTCLLFRGVCFGCVSATNASSSGFMFILWLKSTPPPTQPFSCRYITNQAGLERVRVFILPQFNSHCHEGHRALSSRSDHVCFCHSEP